MTFFHNMINKCDALCFRALPSGAIPAGVNNELEYAKKLGLPVIELPSYSHRQILTVPQTRQFLTESGER